MPPMLAGAAMLVNDAATCVAMVVRNGSGSGTEPCRLSAAPT